MSVACLHGPNCIHCTLTRTNTTTDHQPRPERLLSIYDVAERLNCSDTYVRKHILKQLDTLNVGRNTKITESSVERWIAQQVAAQ